jgi:hypothetical protein
MAVGSGDFVGWRGAVVVGEGGHRTRRRSGGVWPVVGIVGDAQIVAVRSGGRGQQSRAPAFPTYTGCTMPRVSRLNLPRSNPAARPWANGWPGCARSAATLRWSWPTRSESFRPSCRRSRPTCSSSRPRWPCASRWRSVFPPTSCFSRRARNARSASPAARSRAGWSRSRLCRPPSRPRYCAPSTPSWKRGGSHGAAVRSGRVD